MSLSKFSLGLCALLFSVFLAPLSWSSASNSSDPTNASLQPVPAAVAAGVQVNTTQPDGELTLVNSDGDTTELTGVKTDDAGYVTQFTANNITYKYGNGTYNPHWSEMHHYKFKRLSPGRYSWEKISAGGTVLDSGTLDT